MMMEYAKMIDAARAKGIVSEKTMFAKIAHVDKLLEQIKAHAPEAYEEFMRETHTDLYGCHYDYAYADKDIMHISYTDANGVTHTGAHWTPDEILTSTSNMSFPQGTTDADKYVAFNSFYADTCRELSDELIIKVAYLFYFADEDAPQGKIWHYMSAMR